MANRLAALSLILGAGVAHAATNPLLAPSGLPYNAPRFDRIHDTDFAPAIATALRDHQIAIDHIASNRAAPTFDNTIVAMERSGGVLTRVVQIFENLTQSNTDPALDAVKNDVDPKLQAHLDAIHLDPRLFARVKTLYEDRDHLKLDPPSRFPARPHLS